MKFTRSPLLPLMLLCCGSVLLSQAAVWVAEQPAVAARSADAARAGWPANAQPSAPAVVPTEVVVAKAEAGR